MNFNQLTAAAAAAAAGNPSNINMNSFTTAVSNILANSNIDLSQLAGLSQLGQSAALSAANIQPQQQASIPSSRHNLPQAHHHRHSSSNNSTSLASLNSNTHLTNSMSNLASVNDAAQAALANLPASLSNLTSSALADLAASAAAAAAHQSSQQTNVRSSSSSLQSAHHRTSSSSAAAAAAAAAAALANPHHHLNHHSSPSATITAAHQSTSAAKALAAHQSHNIQSMSHHSHTLSHNNAHNSPYNNLNMNNNISKNATSNSLNNSFNASFSNLNRSIVSNNNLNSSSNNNITHAVTASASIPSTLAGATPAPTQTIIATNNINTVTPPKDSICYRIGDCVYFESSPKSPLHIGKIDEICKNSGDSIEVKVVSFFRRRDISSSLITLADKYQYDDVQEEEIKQMSEKDKNALRQRELFYSRQIETIPATSIRGKCTVQLLNESETLASYISKEDHYFYTLVYDPQQKTITADRGEIRVGQRYQAEVQPNPIYIPQAGGDSADPRDLNEMESLMYTPDHDLTDDEINKFLTIAKSVGTFARALDCSSSIKQPSLHLTAASASRDVTLLYAMQLLHQSNYDLGKAVCALVPSTGPVLCRDEIEEWTAGEATLFEEAIEKYGREFNEIRQDFVSISNIILNLKLPCKAPQLSYLFF